jgi:RNA polymerase sigma-70 factor (ECF subfamily)
MLLFTKGGRVDKKEEILIVKKAIKGKPDAYGQLISEYQKYLYRVAFLYMKNEQEALDIVGDTILRLHEKLHVSLSSASSS